jgi:hypothetical protein
VFGVACTSSGKPFDGARFGRVCCSCFRRSRVTAGRTHEGVLADKSQ